MNLSDPLKAIAARLICSPDSQDEGRQLLAHAEAVAALESNDAELREGIGQLLLLWNDQSEAMRKLAADLAKRPVRPVDGMNDQLTDAKRSVE